MILICETWYFVQTSQIVNILTEPEANETNRKCRMVNLNHTLNDSCPYKQRIISTTQLARYRTGTIYFYV